MSHFITKTFIVCLAVICFPALAGAQKPAAPKAPASLPLLTEEVTSEMHEQLLEENEDYLELYLRLVRNQRVEIRWVAIDVLGEMEFNDAIIAALIDRLGDSSDRAREHALDALTLQDVQSPEMIAAVGKLLDDPIRGLKGSAIELLETYGPAAKPYLPRLFEIVAKADNIEFSLAEKALKAILEIGPTAEDVPALRGFYKRHGASALYALAKVESPPQDVIPWLREILQGSDDLERRAAAAWALGRFADEATVIAAAKSSDENLRAAGMEGLGGLRKPPPEAQTLLLSGLQDKSSDVRTHAAEGVAHFAGLPDTLLVAMLRLYGDADPEVREYVSGTVDHLIFAKQKLTHKRGWKLVEQALVKQPNDVGLLMAKAALAFSLADLFIQDDHPKELAMYNAAARGLLPALKSGFQLSASERRQYSYWLYNAGCIACRCDKGDLGLKYLQAAFENGWDDVEEARTDSDFDLIKQLPAFEELLRKYEKK